MEKNKRLSIIFSASYAIMLIVLLGEFFVELFTTGMVNYFLLVPILAGTATYTILTAVIREKEE